MPFMSPADVQQMASAITSRDAKIEKTERKLEKALVMNKFLLIGEALGGAAAFGLLRGYNEDQASGQWNIPHTTIDVELATVGGLTGLGLLGVYYSAFAPYAQHACNLAAGIGGHYVGQVFRKTGRNKKATGGWGKLSTVAGVPGIGELPQYDPTSYDPTQYSAPYDDPVASSLASAGI